MKRSGGTLQVTYSGKPLYWFSGDNAAGQVNGNVTDTWGKWSVRRDGEVGTVWIWIELRHDQPQFRRRFVLAPDSSVERSS